MEWFFLSTKVLDRTDLSLNEKMCYVYLARFFQEEKEEITIKELAAAMGVEEMVAKGAFFAIRTKGLVQSESSIVPGTIIKASQLNDSTEQKVRKYDVTKENSSIKMDPIEEIYEIIDEPIKSKEARIILNFANGDIEQVREKYKIAKASQFNDKVEVLIHELQKKPASKVIKKNQDDTKPFDFEETTEKIVKHKTQVNTYQLNQMQKYGNKK